jgi:hypothetical protein
MASMVATVYARVSTVPTGWSAGKTRRRNGR